MNKKIPILPALLILSLSMMGFSYALWSETLLINTTVNTGELDWEFTATSSIDPDGVNDYHCYDGFADYIFWQGDKNVGYTTAVVTDPHTVTVTMHNVYPSYFVSVSVYAMNTGTIPLIVDKVIIKDDITVEIRKTLPVTIVQLDLNEDDKKDIEIWWKNGFGTQLHTGEPTDEMSFWIHILQDAPQGAQLSFTIEIVAVQYNEYVPP